MEKWNILDHLKLEMLVHRHRNIVDRRAENDANRKLLNSTSTEGESREERLKAWSKAKWEQLVKIDKRLSYVDGMKWVPSIICIAALVLALLTGLLYFDDIMTRGESKPMVFNVTLFLAAFVLLPFIIFVCFLVSSLIQNTKHYVIRPLVNFCKRVFRGVQKANTQIHNSHATRSSEGRNASFFQPVFWAYIWCVKTVFNWFRPKGTKLSDDSSPETHLAIGEALSQALMQQRSTLRLWSQRNFHLFGATYFSAFLLLFFLVLFSASDTPVFKSRINASKGELSEVNRFTMIGAPLSGLIDLPTIEQIQPVQEDRDSSENERLNDRYDWPAYLMLAIIVYVILPRAALIVFQSLWLRHRLNSVDIGALRYEALLSGMYNTPVFPHDPDDPPWQGPTQLPEGPRRPTGARCCIIADASLVNDSFRSLFDGYIQERLKTRKEDPVVWMTLDSRPMEEEQFKDQLSKLLKPWLPLQQSDRILHLVDSGQSPKGNYQTRTKRIRATAGDAVGIIYMLIHDDVEPAHGGKSSELFSVWSQKTLGWGDSNLEVEEYYQGGRNI